MATDVCLHSSNCRHLAIGLRCVSVSDPALRSFYERDGQRRDQPFAASRQCTAARFIPHRRCGRGRLRQRWLDGLVRHSSELRVRCCIETWGTARSRTSPRRPASLPVFQPTALPGVTLTTTGTRTCTSPHRAERGFICTSTTATARSASRRSRAEPLSPAYFVTGRVQHFGDYDGDGYLDIHTNDWGTDISVSTSRLLRNLGAANPGQF